MPSQDDLIKQIADLVQKDFRNQVAAQGHKLTGNLSKSITYQIERIGGDYAIVFYIEEYGLILDKGVKASRIPFGGKSNGAAKTSKYIQGLERYARLRYLVSAKEATRIAFAIANAHKYGGNGMPTKASFRFSKTGKRTGFIDTTLKNIDKPIRQILGRLEFDFVNAA